MQWFGKPVQPRNLALYAHELAANTFSCVFGHTGYLINLGAPASENRERSIKSLIQEIQFAHDLGLPFLVLHPGAHLGAGEKAGFKQIVASSRRPAIPPTTHTLSWVAPDVARNSARNR